MARFYGSIYGSGKTIAQKAGSKDSGINAHIRGWNIGVNVNLLVDKDDNDIVSINLTGGSNDNFSKKCLGRFKLNKKGTIVKIKN